MPQWSTPFEAPANCRGVIIVRERSRLTNNFFRKIPKTSRASRGPRTRGTKHPKTNYLVFSIPGDARGNRHKAIAVVIADVVHAQPIASEVERAASSDESQKTQAERLKNQPEN